MPVEVLAPPLGQTTDTVILADWYKKAGDEVVKGEPLFAVETDKATLDVEASVSGILGEIRAEVGATVRVLSVIAVILQQNETLQPAAIPQFADQKQPAPMERLAGVTHLATPTKARRLFISPRARRLAEQQHVPLESVRASGPEGAIIERDIRAYLERPPAMEQSSAPAITPVARRMAEDAGLDWSSLPGSGPRGQVTRQDVSQWLQSAEKTATVPAEPTQAVPSLSAMESVPFSGVRAVIAGRMSQSHSQTAPVTLTSEVDATALVALRAELAKDNLDVSFNDLFIAVLSKALREHPRLNASLDGDQIRLWSEIHIGLAVDTERGLLAPAIRNVERKGLRQIAEETTAAVERARRGTSTLDELHGSTFTLTNLGMYGIDAFTPIINQPETAILGVGRIKTQPVMVDGAVVGREMVWLSLTFDHRLVDGGPAARFLQRVAQLIERPHLLLS